MKNYGEFSANERIWPMRNFGNFEKNSKGMKEFDWMDRFLEFSVNGKLLDDLIENIKLGLVSDVSGIQLVINLLEKSSFSVSGAKNEMILTMVEKIVYRLHFTLDDILQVPIQYQKPIIMKLCAKNLSKNDNL